MTLSRMRSLSLLVFLSFLHPLPAEANGIAQSIARGLGGGTMHGRPMGGGLLSSGADNKHKLGKIPTGLPKLLRNDYEPGDQVAGFGQRTKLVKPDGSWVLLTYHGRWQARKEYSTGRRVDLNRVSGEVLFDSHQDGTRAAAMPARTVVSRSTSFAAASAP